MSKGTVQMDDAWNGSVPELMNIGVACSDRHIGTEREQSLAMIVEDHHLGTLQYSYADLASRSSRFMQLLRDLGVDTGERVLIRLPNSLDYPTAFLGTMKRGAIAVPTSTLLVAEEVHYLAEDAGVSVLVTHKSMWPDLTARISEVASLRYVLLAGEGPMPDFDDPRLRDLDAELERIESWDAPEATRADDPAYLVYTSGTTGHPKGVLHAHRSLIGRLPASKTWFDFRAGDRIMHSGKFNWTYVLGSGLMDPLYHGMTVIVHEGPNDASTWPRLIAKHGCTIFIGVPTIYRQIIQKTEAGAGDVPTLRHCMSAGEHLSDEMLTAWHERFGMDVYEAIGMSEISYYISQRTGTPIRPGSAGFPQPGHDVRLLDADLNEVAQGEEGVIAIRDTDPGLFLHYWNRPEETAEVRRGGWFLTGDYARIDTDGYLWFLGRRDDIINTFGYRVSPHEIERVMKTHPAVADCVAIGEEVGTEKVIVSAVVIRHLGHDTTAEELIAFGEEQLAGYKRPKRVHIVADYPRTKNGKVIRSQLRALVEAGETASLGRDEPAGEDMLRPRRSMLYVATTQVHHLESAKSLPADALIFDLHEAVPPDRKMEARNNLAAAIRGGGFHGQELVVRVNRRSTPWFADDLARVAELPIDAVLLPHIEAGDELLDAIARLDAAGGARLDVMVQIETPLAVLHIDEIAAASDRLSCLVMNNANLSHALKLKPTPDRTGLFFSHQRVVLAARAFGRNVVDGSHLDLKEARTCELSCRQARDYGFDGKTVIHPAQLTYTNDAFSPKPKEVAQARKIIESMEACESHDETYAVLDDRLLQPVELQAARSLIALHEASERRRAAFEESTQAKPAR